jgi:hypothetical protein
MLRNGAKMLAGAWGTWMAAMLLMTALAYAVGARGSTFDRLPSLGEALPFLWLPLISWTFTTLMTTLVAAGRAWLMALVLGMAFSAGIGLVLLRESLGEPALEVLDIALCAGGGAMALGGTLWAYFAAARRKLITRRSVLIVAAAWSAVSIAVVLSTWRGMPQRDALACLLLGVLALSVFPWAALPLAIRWNRHR